MSARVARTKRPVTGVKLAFDTCCVFYNPNSTNAAQSRSRIETLEELFPPGTVALIETSGDGTEANRRLLINIANKLGARTLLAVAGGDGSVNLLVDTLLRDPAFTQEQRRTTVLPLWGGNGNDLACMLNGPAGRVRLSKLLQSAKRIAVYPLRCEFTSEEDAQTQLAICYASFGASAYAAQWLERLRGGKSLWHRVGIARFLYEIGMVSKAMLRSPRFSVEDDTTTHPVFDRIFINGSRYAKVAGVPQKLTDRQFYYVNVEQKKVSTLAFHITEIIRRHPDQYLIGGKRTIGFTLRETALAQLDGEVMQLGPGTIVRISLNDEPFYALSTLLGR